MKHYMGIAVGGKVINVRRVAIEGRVYYSEQDFNKIIKLLDLDVFTDISDKDVSTPKTDNSLRGPGFNS